MKSGYRVKVWNQNLPLSLLIYNQAHPNIVVYSLKRFKFNFQFFLLTQILSYILGA